MMNVLACARTMLAIEGSQAQRAVPKRYNVAGRKVFHQGCRFRPHVLCAAKPLGRKDLARLFALALYPAPLKHLVGRRLFMSGCAMVLTDLSLQILVIVKQNTRRMHHACVGWGVMEKIMMKNATLVAIGFATLTASASMAQAKNLCTLIMDSATSTQLFMQGDCNSRVTPASTFKIALAAIGYDTGVLKDAHAPTLNFQPGYPDWGGENWKQPTDPTRWLKYSVVWYSQQITHQLGAAKFADYVKRIDYGNADVNGDPGKNNGLERAWIASSLQISPMEQANFLTRLLNFKLPLSKSAMEKTIAIVETQDKKPDGWTIQGKTGMAYPRGADGSFDYARSWGWYVGWGEKDGRRIVFVRLIKDEKREKISAGIRARDSLLQDLPALLKQQSD
nr:class D beta-lactamase [Allorhizobium terrae]